MVHGGGSLLHDMAHRYRVPLASADVGWLAIAHGAPQMLAYIDPGAGSLLIQALIAAVVSVPFFLRSQLRATWNRLRRPGPPPDTAPRAQTEE